MSQTEFFTEPTTILRTPSWLGNKVHEIKRDSRHHALRQPAIRSAAHNGSPNLIDHLQDAFPPLQ